MNKRITDLTNEEIKEFFRSLNDDFKLLDISRDKARDEITCNIRSSYWIEFNTSRVYEENKLILTDPYDWNDSEDSIYIQYGEEALENWKQFCFAKGIYPDWMLNNPYTKAHVVQLTNEQLNLIRANIIGTRSFLIKGKDDEDGPKVINLLNYLKQIEGKNEN